MRWGDIGLSQENDDNVPLLLRFITPDQFVAIHYGPTVWLPVTPLYPQRKTHHMLIKWLTLIYKVIQTHIHTYIQTDRQIDRQIDRQTDWQIDWQIDWLTDRQIEIPSFIITVEYVGSACDHEIRKNTCFCFKFLRSRDTFIVARDKGATQQGNYW